MLEFVQATTDEYYLTWELHTGVNFSLDEGILELLPLYIVQQFAEQCHNREFQVG